MSGATSRRPSPLTQLTSTSLSGPGVFGLVVDGWGGDFGSYSVSVSGL